MKISFVLKGVAGLLFAHAAVAVWAQNPVGNALTIGMDDLAAIKRRAEAGDASAQALLGDSLASQFRASEALEWYRKAAGQGNVNAEFRLGEMLLFGGSGIPQELAVKPNPAEGLRWTFRAGTNFHPYACWNMGKALRAGWGTSTNLVAAYAWLKLFSETSPGSIVGRSQMNQLALEMDTDSLRRAESLAAQFRAGHWEAPVARVIAEGDPRLRLSSVTFGTKTSLVVINGKTFAEGESARVPVKPGFLNIKCLAIRKDSAVVLVEGEDTERILGLR